MSEKEKAKDLVDKFSNIENAALKVLRGAVLTNIAKKAALITVEEMIKYCDTESDFKYWQSVKQEIRDL
jgi:hypothetical protein